MLFEVTKIQILKVIYNEGVNNDFIDYVVLNHKDTNFESNSQLSFNTGVANAGCFKSQRYKF